MRAREILSKNLRALIDEARANRPQLGSIEKVAQISAELTHGATRLSKSRVGRIVKGSHATDVDALGDLAQAFGLEPWQLLVEGLNPKALPRLADPQLLSQIKELIGSAAVASPPQPPSAQEMRPLQREAGRREKPIIGPALKTAFGPKGGKKNARSGTEKVPKQKGRSSRKGTAGPG